jgi:hypothetical protein
LRKRRFSAENLRTTRMRRIQRILRRKTSNPARTPIATAGSRITTPHTPNLISPPDPRLKQALNRPVFLLAKSPDKQTEPIAQFPVALPAKTPKTGRSDTREKWQSGAEMSPDTIPGGWYSHHVPGYETSQPWISDSMGTPRSPFHPT